MQIHFLNFEEKIIDMAQNFHFNGYNPSEKKIKYSPDGKITMASLNLKQI